MSPVGFTVSPPGPNCAHTLDGGNGNKEWFCCSLLFLAISFMSALFALVLYGIISHLPIPWEFRLSTIWIISVLCCSCCCVLQNITGIRNSRTGNRTQPGFGTGTRNRSVGTITAFDDFHSYDLNMLGSVVERPYLSSFTHTRTNNCEIPNISRPVLEDFSLHRPRWDFESRVAESDRLPISLSVPFSEPSNSVVANAPSAPPYRVASVFTSYEEAINQPNYEIEEEPPPTYDKIVLNINI